MVGKQGPAGHGHCPRHPEAAEYPSSRVRFLLGQIDSIIDVSEQDLLRIYDLATGTAKQRHLQPQQVSLGHYYSNGESGADWSVRQVVDESRNPDPDKDSVVYKVAAGAGLRSSGVMTRTQFARWARYEVTRDDDNWNRIES